MRLLSHYWQPIFRHVRRTNIYDIEEIKSLFWFMAEIMHLYSLEFYFSFQIS